MKRLLASDLHLSEKYPQITRRFFTLLEHAQNNADELYLLGDIFDYWLGDDDRSPFNESITDALSTLSHSGTRVFLQHGNRDFLIGHDFCSRAGCTLLDDPHLLLSPSERPYALLMHGDLLCTNDTKYQEFRQKVHNPQWQKEVLAMPLSERAQLAQKYQMGSKKSKRLTPEEIMDVNPQTVEDMLLKFGVTLLIHGHTHRPFAHKIKLVDKSAYRLVLGDWRPDEKAQCLCLENENWQFFEI